MEIQGPGPVCRQNLTRHLAHNSAAAAKQLIVYNLPPPTPSKNNFGILLTKLVPVFNNFRITRTVKTQYINTTESDSVTRKVV